jgi:hypothetical protein
MRQVEHPPTLHSLKYLIRVEERGADDDHGI